PGVSPLLSIRKKVALGTQFAPSTLDLDRDAKKKLRRSRNAVWLKREGSMSQILEKERVKDEAVRRVSISKLLVTTDFSEVSDHALDYAIALARRYDARIYLAHVITPDPFQFAEPQLAQATYEKVRQAAEEGITDILISGKLRGVPHEVLME